MKAKLSPLALAVAGLFAVSTSPTFAGQSQHHHQQQNHQPPVIILQLPPPPTASATATVNDSQTITDNYVYNEGTNNNAQSLGSISASGNVGVNVAAGDYNQQANAVALASADQDFVFSSANATTMITQQGNSYTVDNYSTQNNANLDGSISASSGNIGVNVAAGNFNQQKNDLAIAVSNGEHSSAGGTVVQNSSGNVTNNKAVLQYGSAEVSLNVGLGGGYIGGGAGGYGGTYNGTGTESTSNPNDRNYHPSQPTTTISESGTEHGGLAFGEAGAIVLGGVASGQIPIVTGFQQVVNNVATLNGSIDGVSGNVGVNVTAGTGNQQSNSLSIAASTKTSM